MNRMWLRVSKEFMATIVHRRITSYPDMVCNLSVSLWRGKSCDNLNPCQPLGVGPARTLSYEWTPLPSISISAVGEGCRCVKGFGGCHMDDRMLRSLQFCFSNKIIKLSQLLSAAFYCQLDARLWRGLFALLRSFCLRTFLSLSVWEFSVTHFINVLIIPDKRSARRSPALSLCFSALPLFMFFCSLV